MRLSFMYSVTKCYITMSNQEKKSVVVLYEFLWVP